MEACNYKGHAVCVACPAQSHIKAMLKLAKLLYHKGFHITFVNTEFNNQSVRFFNSLDGLPSFRFETIHPPADEKYIRNDFMLEKFLELLDKLNDSTSNVNQPVVSCIISDVFMPFTVAAAQQLGLPIVTFITISACSFMGVKHFRVLKEKGLTPVKDESCFTKEYMDTVIDWIPGMKDIRIRDLPGFVRITDPNDFTFNYVMDAAESASKASGIVFHTFDALEGQVLDALSSMFPHLYTIAPFQFLLEHIEGQDGMINSIRYNPWKEETECLQWLDSKDPNSVIYVNFGSIAVMTKQQLTEVGMGLVYSNHYFLMIIRGNLISGDKTDLPSDFEAEAKGKGFIASWCPQEEVLKHPSVGGFFTHSGWNSTIESLSAGVPMICWPFGSDQTTNCNYTCTEWGVGLEINGEKEVKRYDVEKLVRELMEEEKGKQMRNKATEWKKLAEEAAAPGGSSSRNLEKLVNEILQSKEHMSL